MLSIIYSLYKSNRKASGSTQPSNGHRCLSIHPRGLYLNGKCYTSGKSVSYNPYAQMRECPISVGSIRITTLINSINTTRVIDTSEPDIVDMNTTEPEVVLHGNEKRKQSCKRVGGEKKRVGHDRERDFLHQYNVEDLDKPTEYGPKSDTTIHPEHPICNVLANTLGVSHFNVSNKSGENLQFTLGRIPELETITDETFQSDSVRAIFNKYLKKTHSDRPADLLVYKDIPNRRWVFFNMDHIVDFIVAKCEWRKLETGRIKGDFADKSKKGKSQYITYEFRDTHNSYFLGLNGGKGLKFIELLMDAEMGIPYYCDAFQ